MKKNELNIKKIIQSPFTWKHYFASVLLPLKFINWTSINRYPLYGIVFIFSFFKQSKTTIKKESKKYFFVDYLLYMLIFLSLSKISEKLILISTIK